MTKKDKYSKVLEMFVSDDFFRTDMRAPFIQNGMYIATNAHILISLPVGAIDLDYKVQSNPNCLSAMTYDKPFSRKITVQQLKDVIEKFSKKNPEYTYPPKDCNNCDGEGFEECDLGHDHECHICNGSGKIEGKNPTGKMIPDHKSALGIWGRFIMIDKLQLFIKACEILEVSNVEEVSAGSIRYTFKMGEFEVLIMGCAYVEENCSQTDLV